MGEGERIGKMRVRWETMLTINSGILCWRGKEGGEVATINCISCGRIVI